MLEYPFDTTECLNHVGAVIIEVPQFTVVFLMCPPEWILFEHLILLEVLPDPPPFVVCECQPILLEEGVNARNTAVPRIFQVVESQTTVLSGRFLTLQGVFSPYTLRVQELRLPRLDVTVQVWD